MTDYFNTLKTFIDDELLHVTITKNEDIQEMIDMVSTMENHLSSVLYLHKTRKLFNMVYETRCKLFRECDRIQNKIIEGQIKHNPTIPRIIVENYMETLKNSNKYIN